MKKIIDANVILRYLIKDDCLMSETAKQIIDNGASTLPEIIAEVIYVLKGVYKVSRIETSKVLIDFLYEISLERKEVILEALTIYGETTFDYVDCVLIAQNRLFRDEICTFDKKLSTAIKNV